MKNGVNVADKKMMMRMFSKGESMSKVSKALNVQPTVIESFAKYYRDKKVLKAAPKD